MRAIHLILIIFALLVGSGAARAERLVVFAAASLKEPLDQVLDGMADVVVSYGGSGALTRQILLGAPADLVILAHPQWMDLLAEAGLVGPAGRRDLLGNRLVLIGAAGAGPLALSPDAVAEALGSQGRLAMGLTTAVPAGQYGRAALEALGLWEGVSGRLAEVDNVRVALALVARGEAPLGLVYATDARASDAVAVRAEVPEDSHPVIRYPAAVLRPSVRAEAVWQALQSEDARRLFEAAGFLWVEAP